METFKVGDLVYFEEDFISGEIVEIDGDSALVEFTTPVGGGCLPFKLSELKNEKEMGECNMNEHPVWKVLNREKYVKEFIPQAEKMYDFIKSIVNTCGNTTVDENTVHTMQVFFNMWNEYLSETFWILDSLVNKDTQ